PHNPHMVTLLTYAVPAFVIILETSLASHLTTLRETPGRQRTMVVWGTWLAAMVAALAMPALIIVSQIMVQPQHQTPRQFWLMLLNVVGMGTIALVAHG